MIQKTLLWDWSFKIRIEFFETLNVLFFASDSFSDSTRAESSLFWKHRSWKRLDLPAVRDLSIFWDKAWGTYKGRQKLQFHSYLQYLGQWWCKTGCTSTLDCHPGRQSLHLLPFKPNFSSLNFSCIFDTIFSNLEKLNFFSHFFP